MNTHEGSNKELGKRLDQAQAVVDSLLRGEIDQIIGVDGPLVVRLKSLIDENERLAQEWQTTFDATNDAIWVLDVNHRIVRSNRTAERFFGKAREEFIGHHCWEIVHGISSPIPECPILRARKSLCRETTEMQISSCWFKVTVDPILDTEGKYAGAVHIVTDITERKQTEEKLLESENRNRIISEMVSDYAYIFRVTAEGNLIGEWVTDSFTRVFGYTIEEGEARGGWQTLVFPDDMEIALAHAQKVVGGEADICEMRWVTARGEIRWLRDYARPVYDEISKRVVRIYGASQDITERKRAEEALRESEAKYRQIAELLPEVVFECDIEGNLTFVNRAAFEKFGYTQEDFKRGVNAHQFIVPADRKKLDVNIRTIVSGITQGPSEYLALRKDGTEFPVLVYSSPIIRDGRPIGLRGILVDITELKRAQEEKERLHVQLLQAQKMESVGRLAGGIAHDFNNMLSIILGYAEMVMKKLDPEDPLSNSVKEIMKAGERAAELTRQLLAFGRKQIFQPQVLNLTDQVRHLENMLRRLIGEDIDLFLALADNLALVYMDPVQFDQIIMNLAVNARDAMPRGGKLTIETSNVTVDDMFANIHPGVMPGQYVLISVTDSGCGMDETVLAHIFEPFFTTKEKGKGTGLGLATVYGIVKQSGGHIWVYSEPGQGTTFKIYLPQSHAKPRGQEISPKEGKEIGSGMRILVVEDEESLRRLMQTILLELGFQVLVAANGREALLMVEEHGLRPDLVITDLVMPGMSGAVLAERLRKSQPDLKLLFMTGYTDNAIVHNGALDQGTLLIQKPFSRKDIVEKIHRVLNGQ